MKRVKWIRSLLLCALIAVLLVPANVCAAGAETARNAVSLKNQEIPFSKIANARDLGGYTTKDGRRIKKGILIRSAELSYATSADRRMLKHVYNLGMIIDMRYKADFKHCPDKKINGVKYVKLSVFKGSGNKKSARKRFRLFKGKSSGSLKKTAARRAKRYGGAYGMLTGSHSRKAYKRYFKYLLNNNNEKAILFHCVHGKDRTGIAAFVTLIALGVDEETAYKEYALTNAWVRKYCPKKSEWKKLGVSEANLRSAVRKVKKKYGSLNKFLLKAYGLNSSKLNKLRNIYLE